MKEEEEGNRISEFVVALASGNERLEAYAEKLYSEKVSLLVFYNAKKLGFSEKSSISPRDIDAETRFLPRV